MAEHNRPAGRRLGLTGAEAARRLAQFGPNALPTPAPIGLPRRLLRQFASPLMYLLLFALAFDAGLWVREGAEGAPAESLAIALILILNAGLGAYQESKAEAALARLKVLATPFAWVLRDGQLGQVASTAIVPGDLVRVEAGDRVPADGLLVDDHGLSVDESIMTGESLPVERLGGDTLLSGTLVARGKGYFEVTRTGTTSATGRLATMIGGIETGKTPLERRLETFGNQVAAAILAMGAVLILGGLIAEGPERIGHVVLFSVALAVAAVPEGLPAVMTLALALGVERLSGRRAIVRRLSAVEALGSVTVIATDKTGTLTENRMHVKAIETCDEARALEAMVLANDAEIASRAGDPLELALFDFAARHGLDPQGLAAAQARCSCRPFDSLSRFMRVTVVQNGQRISYLKGAPEVILARSRLEPAERQSWEKKALTHAADGYRVIALGWCENEGEDDITFLGLVMLWDPPRPEVPDAVRRALDAGVRVIMITGDHPATSAAVARIVGISSEGVLTGADLEAMSAAELRDAVRVTGVFARVAPEQKLLLVEALKGLGEIVAVTGDGVNDAPALKRSDIGVAMGLRGSDVAREVSDIVLMDDNFSTIVAAIEEGRSIYENIQKCIRFLFSTNLALILLILGGLLIAVLLGLKDPSGGAFLLPLTAVQLLWINVIADGPPALALALDRNPVVMSQPPRPPTSQLLDKASMRFIVASGAIKAALGIGLFMLLPALGYSLEVTRTALFLFESMAQLVFAYPARWIGAAPLSNRALHAAVGLGLVLQVLTVLQPGLRALLQLVAVDGFVFSLVIVGTAVSWVAAEACGRLLMTRSTPVL